MREITSTKKVFFFDELTPELKKVVLDKYRDWNTNSWNRNGWAGWIEEQITEELEEVGFKDINILFNGFGSQGDGACFEARMDNDGMMKFLKKNEIAGNYPHVEKALREESEKGLHVSVKIKHEGHYYHEYMTDTIDSTEMQDNKELSGELRKEWEDIISFIDDRVHGRTDKTKNCGAGWLISKNKEIYKRIEDEYDYLESDESLSELFEETGKEFDEEGEMQDY